jgi:Domain of unknown function (DUF4129)
VLDPAPTSSRRARLLAVAAGVVVLLGIVALASRTGVGKGTDAGPSTDYLSYAYTAFFILFVLAIPATLWALWAEGGRTASERPSFKRAVIQNLLTFGIICLLVGGAVYLNKHHHFVFHRPDAKALNNAHKAVTHKNGKPVKVEPTFKWPVLWVALVLLAAASVPVVREARRRRAKRVPLDWEPPTLADELSGEIGLALDDLRSESDIRRAVIAAYARMEKVLARAGLRRSASETAMEFLRRVLGDLRVGAPAAQELTQLFEEAKFSSHDLDESARTRAINALETIRAELLAEEAAA